MRLVTADEMRLLDRITIESGRASAEILMERAGAGVVEAMERHYGSMLAMRVLVLCGAGNNGGDGFVAARHLQRRGAVVRVGLLGDPARLGPQARANRVRLGEADLDPVVVGSAEQLGALVGAFDGWDFALDALLGTGARGTPEGLMAAGVEALRALDDAGTTVIGVDVPTGVNPDTGAIARRAVRADLTITFGCPKRGHFLYPGRAFTGALEVVDIGLALDSMDPAQQMVTLATAPEMAALLPTRDPRAHKRSVGVVLLIGGSVGLTGAVTLAARAASRSGAGYVQAAVPTSLNDVLEAKLTEEMTLPMPETPERTLAVAALEPLLARAADADAVVIGSGMSRHREAAEIARRIAAACERPVVLDADGLNAFEEHRDAIGRGRSPWILTPHVGEMSRLTGLDAQAIEAGRIDLARDWARRWRAVVVLKGAPTVTAAPDGQVTLNPNGNPGMATAGTGDVLSGAIASLVAQGLAPYDAARLGVFVHGMAGDLAAADKGQSGLVAGDVIEHLPLAIVGLAQLRARQTAGARTMISARSQAEVG